MLVQDVEPSESSMPSVATEDLRLAFGDFGQPSDESLHDRGDVIDGDMLACCKTGQGCDEALKIR